MHRVLVDERNLGQIHCIKWKEIEELVINIYSKHVCECYIYLITIMDARFSRPADERPHIVRAQTLQQIAHFHRDGAGFFEILQTQNLKYELE